MLTRAIRKAKTIRYQKSLKGRNIFVGRGVKLSLGTTFEDNSKINRGTMIVNSHIGRGTVIGGNCILNFVEIGRFCSIAPKVEVIYGTHPEGTFITTHPAFYSVSGDAGITFTKSQKFVEHKLTGNGRSATIGNDVWIGYGASILEGVTIGDGAIIGAKATVTRDVEPYSINVGVPARKVGYRFKAEEIHVLRQLQWWNRDLEWLRENAVYFDDISKISELEASISG